MSALLKAHRAELKTLTRLAERDLTLIWEGLNHADAIATRDALAEILPDLVSMYGAAAATLAADWYEEMRIEAAIDSAFTAITATLPDLGRTEALAGWAVGPLFGAEPNTATALANVAGGLQWIIADADRETIMESSIADPAARGWERVADGGCGFCEMLAGRGVVYSESSADFASHNNCQCYAAPAWDGEPKPVKAYTPSKTVATDADRARAREYIKTH